MWTMASAKGEVGLDGVLCGGCGGGGSGVPGSAVAAAARDGD